MPFLNFPPLVCTISGSVACLPLFFHCGCSRVGLPRCFLLSHSKGSFCRCTAGSALSVCLVELGKLSKVVPQAACGSSGAAGAAAPAAAMQSRQPSIFRIGRWGASVPQSLCLSVLVPISPLLTEIRQSSSNECCETAALLAQGAYSLANWLHLCPHFRFTYCSSTNIFASPPLKT